MQARWIRLRNRETANGLRNSGWTARKWGSDGRQLEGDGGHKLVVARAVGAFAQSLPSLRSPNAVKKLMPGKHCWSVCPEDVRVCDQFAYCTGLQFLTSLGLCSRGGWGDCHTAEAARGQRRA